MKNSSTIVIQSSTSQQEHRQLDGSDDADSDSIKNFVWLSDVHVDLKFGDGKESAGEPFCGTASEDLPPPFGCETNVKLLETVMNYATSRIESGEDEEPFFVVVTGDLNRHDMERIPNEEDAKKLFESTIGYVSSMIRNSFRTKTIIFSLGNNECNPDHYLDDANLRTLHDIFKGPFEFTSAQSETFLKGGYLMYEISPKWHVLSMNTNVFSIEAFGNLSVDPNEQLQWLEDHLEQCRQTSAKAWIVGHIAPVLQSYEKGEPLWQSTYVHQYLSIIEKYEDTIAAQLFGHIHTNEFRLIPKQNNNNDFVKIPIFTTGAITPLFGNLPNYRTVSFYNDNNEQSAYELVDFYPHVYNTTDQTWFHPPPFKQAYGNIPDIYAPTLDENIIRPMLSNNNPNGEVIFDTSMVRLKYHTSPNLCDKLSCRVPWACTMITTFPDEYESCLKRHTPIFSVVTNNKTAGFILGFLLVALILVAIVLLFKQFKKRKQSSKMEMVPGNEDDNLWSCDMDSVNQDNQTYDSVADDNKPLPVIT